MELTCPTCQEPMRTYERNGVHVDQCTECRGIFLDRGELERLIDAEAAWHDGGRSTATPAPRAAPGHQAGGHGSGGYGAGGLGAVVGEVLDQVQKRHPSGVRALVQARAVVPGRAVRLEEDHPSFTPRRLGAGP